MPAERSLQTSDVDPPLKVACCPGLFVRYRWPLSGHAGLVPGNPRPRNTGSEHPTKFEPPTTPATHPRRRLAKRTTSASQQQVNTEFRPGSSGLVLPNLCSNGHVVFTCSTQNRMTFPGIPPTAPFDGVGGKALHTSCCARGLSQGFICLVNCHSVHVGIRKSFAFTRLV